MRTFGSDERSTCAGAGAPLPLPDSSPSRPSSVGSRLSPIIPETPTTMRFGVYH